MVERCFRNGSTVMEKVGKKWLNHCGDRFSEWLNHYAESGKEMGRSRGIKREIHEVFVVDCWDVILASGPGAGGRYRFPWTMVAIILDIYSRHRNCELSFGLHLAGMRGIGGNYLMLRLHIFCYCLAEARENYCQFDWALILLELSPDTAY